MIINQYVKYRKIFIADQERLSNRDSSAQLGVVTCRPGKCFIR